VTGLSTSKRFLNFNQASDSTPAKRPRPLPSQRRSQLRLQLLSSVEKPSGQQKDNIGSGEFGCCPSFALRSDLYDTDDVTVDSPGQCVVETPESVLRGPSLPGLGETVLSPALNKPGPEDNPGSGKEFPQLHHLSSSNHSSIRRRLRAHPFQSNSRSRQSQAVAVRILCDHRIPSFCSSSFPVGRTSECCEGCCW
jgi:hypothetical protein